VSAPLKRCTVAYATPARQYLWELELPEDACIGQALDAARAQAGGLEIAWDSLAVGIYGVLHERADPCLDGDRIELYRPLTRDPRSRRRERVQRERRGKAG
jgi:uncharacterized protein